MRPATTVSQNLQSRFGVVLENALQILKSLRNSRYLRSARISNLRKRNRASKLLDRYYEAHGRAVIRFGEVFVIS